MKITRSQLKEIIREEVIKFITESEDDKYTHIGYGKYKLKGKEDDKSSPTFTKDDSGKYIPTKSDKGGKGQQKPKVNIFDKPKEKPKEKKPKSDTPKVSSDKVTDVLPNANPETFEKPSDINKIPDSQKMEVSMKIDKLAELAKEAKEKGEAAPNYNLCEITVPGTNLYCEGNAGIPREQMPQFKGTPTPGSPASKLPKDNSGEVDTEPMFRAMLKKNGIKTVETEIPSDRLKATQSELVGAKVAGMTQALEEDPNHPAITAPIYVSRDGYVIDGHHRWAAMTSYAMKTGKPIKMKVIVIDKDIKDIIPMANQFAEEIGVAAKKADTKQESLQLKEIIRKEIQLFSERYSGFRDSWRGVTKRDAMELAKKNNLKFVQDKKHTQYWWAFRPGAKQAIFKWDEEGNELISDYSPMELRMRKINENMLEESTFVFSYGEGRDKFMHQLNAFRLKDAFEKFVKMYKIPKSDWKKISVKKSGGFFGGGKNKGWHTYEP